MKKIIIIAMTLFSPICSAHFDHQATNEIEITKNDTITLSGIAWRIFGTVWNTAEIVSHSHAIYQDPYSLANVYHGVELTTHSGNVATYIEASNPAVTFSLFCFNLFAVYSQTTKLTENQHRTAAAIISAGLSTVDAVGHTSDTIFTGMKLITPLISPRTNTNNTDL